jgi:hypothetical protein
MAGHTSICGTPQVSKYCSCIYFKKKQKTNRKKKNRVSEAVVVLGQENKKKMIFFQGLNLDECKIKIKQK